MHHQLHGDGQGDRSTTELSVNQRSTDKGCVPTTKKGSTTLYIPLLLQLVMDCVDPCIGASEGSGDAST